MAKYPNPMTIDVAASRMYEQLEKLSALTAFIDLVNQENIPLYLRGCSIRGAPTTEVQDVMIGDHPDGIKQMHPVDSEEFHPVGNTIVVTKSLSNQSTYLTVQAFNIEGLDYTVVDEFGYLSLDHFPLHEVVVYFRDLPLLSSPGPSSKESTLPTHPPEWKKYLCDDDIERLILMVEALAEETGLIPDFDRKDPAAYKEFCMRCYEKLLSPTKAQIIAFMKHKHPTSFDGASSDFGKIAINKVIDLKKGTSKGRKTSLLAKYHKLK